MPVPRPSSSRHIDASPWLASTFLRMRSVSCVTCSRSDWFHGIDILRLMPARPIASPIVPSTASRRGAWATVTILLLLAAGCALTVLIFQPGYMTVDARYLYDDMRAWTLNDWQSPVMALLWRLIDPIAPGAWSMFLLIAALYWLGFGMLALIVARRSV